MSKLVRLHAKNYRSLADLSFEVGSINVFFGPNGSGKSAILDVLRFLKDCAVKSVEYAASQRDRGVGLLWDGAEEGEITSILVETLQAKYEISWRYRVGRIDTFIEESLYDNVIYDNDDGSSKPNLIDRKFGSEQAKIWSQAKNKYKSFMNFDPHKLALMGATLPDMDISYIACGLFRNLKELKCYSSRRIDLTVLRNRGSELGSTVELKENCENLWSVLRKLYFRQGKDNRYQTIMKFMQETFPSLKEIYFEEEKIDSSKIYAYFVDRQLRKSLPISSLSDGHLQMLINLTALFCAEKRVDKSCSLILFDEPDLSLHPWALSVFAKAVKLAVKDWNKQVFIATHSPVLISQFDNQDIISTSRDNERRTILKRVNEIEYLQDLLEQYATGSLYMSEAIAPQSQSVVEEIVT